MKLGVTLMVLGSLLFGFNLFFAIGIALAGGGQVYIFTGLIVPVGLIVWGACRVSGARKKEWYEKH